VKPLKPWQLVLLPAAISFLLTAAAIPAGDWLSTAGLSLAAGVAALSLMGISSLLAARWGVLESLCGGLDRMYLAHKWLGVWALGLASFHLVFKAGLPHWEMAAILPLPREAARFIRQLSYVALVFIVLLALNRNIRYSVWRWWHKLSGPLFLVVILHWLSIRSPFALATPAGIWLAVIAALGLAAALYKLLLYPFLAPHAEYEVVDISPGPHAVKLRLRPMAKAITFAPGQFGFLRLHAEGFREPHPFTIANGNRGDGQLEFLIRGLGDYTRRLVSGVRTGMRAEIHAPYGRFKRQLQAPREIWVAGGVGISPFVAWFDDEDAGGFDKVTLFYFYTPGREFPDPQVLAGMAAQRGAEFIAVTDHALFHQRFDAIAQHTSPERIAVSFCGPRGLLTVVRRQMRASGVPEYNLHHELFEFR
jgi:predicted ferric reductase